MRSSVSDLSRLRTSTGVSIDAFAASSGFYRRTVYRWERGEAPPRKAAVRMLDTLIREHRQAAAPSSTKAFRFIDLFAGIGGLRRGSTRTASAIALTSRRWRVSSTMCGCCRSADSVSNHYDDRPDQG